MSEAPEYRQMTAGEETAVCEMVSRVFGEFVGPGYSSRGRTEFLFIGYLNATNAPILPRPFSSLAASTLS